MLATACSAILILLQYKIILAHIDATSFGIWTLVISTTSITRFSELGLGGSIVRQIATHMARNESRRAVAAVGTASIIMATAMLAIIIAAYLPILLTLQSTLAPQDFDLASSLLPYAAAAFYAGSIANIFSSAVDGCQRADLRSKTNIALGLLSFGCCVTVAMTTKSIASVAIAQAIITGISIILHAAVAKALIPKLNICKPEWSKKEIMEMLPTAGYFQVSSIGMALFDPLIKLLISKFGTSELIVYYEIANQIISRTKSFIVSANQTIVAKIAQLQQQSQEELETLYNIQILVATKLAAPFFLICTIFTAIVSSYISPSGTSQIATFSYILTLGNLLNILAIPAYFKNQGIGHNKTNAIHHLIMGAAAAALSPIFGSIFGPTGVVAGAALSIAISSLFLLMKENIRNRAASLSYWKYMNGPLFATIVITTVTNIFQATATDNGTRILELSICVLCLLYLEYISRSIRDTITCLRDKKT